MGEHRAASNIDVQQDNRSYSAVDSGEALAWNCSADCYAAFVVGCQKPPSPDLTFNKTQRDSTSTVNQEEMKVRSKAENDFLLGLTSGSLALSLRSNVVISEENLKVGAIDEAEVRSKVQGQLLHSLDSGSLTAALKTKHPAASVIDMQQDDHLRSALDSGEAMAWNCYAGCYAACMVGCPKPPSPDVTFKKTQRDSTTTVNQEEMRVRSKAQSDLLLGLAS